MQSTLDISKSQFIPNYLYFKVAFSGPRLFTSRCQQFEMHGVEKQINGYKRLQIAYKITVRKQNNWKRRQKFKTQRTTKKK